MRVNLQRSLGGIEGADEASGRSALVDSLEQGLGLVAKEVGVSGVVSGPGFQQADCEVHLTSKKCKLPFDPCPTGDA